MTLPCPPRPLLLLPRRPRSRFVPGPRPAVGGGEPPGEDGGVGVVRHPRGSHVGRGSDRHGVGARCAAAAVLKTAAAAFTGAGQTNHKQTGCCYADERRPDHLGGPETGTLVNRRQHRGGCSSATGAPRSALAFSPSLLPQETRLPLRLLPSRHVARASFLSIAAAMLVL